MEKLRYSAIGRDVNVSKTDSVFSKHWDSACCDDLIPPSESIRDVIDPTFIDVDRYRRTRDAEMNQPGQKQEGETYDTSRVQVTKYSRPLVAEFSKNTRNPVMFHSDSGGSCDISSSSELLLPRFFVAKRMTREAHQLYKSDLLLFHPSRAACSH
jgi:hypothetical protein